MMNHHQEYMELAGHDEEEGYLDEEKMELAGHDEEEGYLGKVKRAIWFCVVNDEEEGYLGKVKRAIWFCVVTYSWFACAIAGWVLYIVELKMPARYDKLVFDSFGYSTALYLPLLVVIESCRKNKPLKMKPWFKVLVDYAFVLYFGFAYFYIAASSRNHRNDDSLLVLLVSVIAIATHLHIISLINLLGAYENFGFLDCSLALMLHAASFLSCKYSEYAPLAVMLLAFALQPMKKSYQDLQKHSQHQKSTSTIFVMK